MKLALVNIENNDIFSNFSTSNMKIVEIKKNASVKSENLFFENNFGKIYEDSILININEQKLHIKEIAFLQIKSQVDKTYNFTAFILGIVMLIKATLTNNNSVFFLLLIIFMMMCFVIGVFYKKENYFVQVVFCRAEQIAIRINKNQRKETDVFIKKLSIYRHQNSYLKH